MTLSFRAGSALYLGFALALLALTAHVAAAGYVNAGALRLWADSIMAWETESFAQDRIAVVYPQLRFYLSLLFFALMPDPRAAGLGLFGAATAAIVVLIWIAMLRNGGWGRVTSVLAAILLALHPAFLWSATRAGGEPLSLIGMTLIGACVLSLAHAYSLSVFITTALLLAVYFVVDERFPFLLVALVPLLPVFASPKIIRLGPGGFFIVTLMPLVSAFLAFVYVSWVFTGDPLRFVEGESSVLAGAYYTQEAHPWLMRHGGQLAAPLATAFALAVAAAPAAVAGLAIVARAPREFAAIALMIVTPVVGLAVATLTRFAAHPLEFLFLLPVASCVAMCCARGRAQRALLVALALVGQLGGWAMFAAWADADRRHWRGALFGPVTETMTGERKLAAFLRDGPPTLIDDALGFPVIAALASTRNLVLPATTEFRLAITARQVDVAQIAIPDPRQGFGRRDRLNQNFPSLWDDGLPGYELVYDQAGWRVYRRDAS
jgi:hypothetical protein